MRGFDRNALGRMALRIDRRTHRLLALGLLTSLVCLLLGEVYGVQSTFGSRRGVYVDDARCTQVADLSRKRAWRELVEYVERQDLFSDSNVLRQLGRAYAMLGHVDEAEKCYKKALQTRLWTLTAATCLCNCTKERPC